MSWNRGKGRAAAFLLDLVGHGGDECIRWPFTRNQRGYGLLGWNGTHQEAHRLMCKLAHGEPPTPEHQATHNCGRGHLGCVNPNHLEWKTGSQNQFDRRRHGTHGCGRGRRGALTPAQIAEIRASKGAVTQRELAARYGVADATIRWWQNTDRQPAPPGTSDSSIRRRAKRASN